MSHPEPFINQFLYFVWILHQYREPFLHLYWNKQPCLETGLELSGLCPHLHRMRESIEFYELGTYYLVPMTNVVVLLQWTVLIDTVRVVLISLYGYIFV